MFVWLRHPGHLRHSVYCVSNAEQLRLPGCDIVTSKTSFHLRHGACHIVLASWKLHGWGALGHESALLTWKEVVRGRRVE